MNKLSELYIKLGKQTLSWYELDYESYDEWTDYEKVFDKMEEDILITIKELQEEIKKLNSK